jgi:hypothetical protein
VTEQCDRGDDAWEQGAWIWSALLYGVLGIATVLALLDGEPSGGDRWVMLALAASMVAWNLAFERLRVSEGPPWPVLLYWAGLVVLWFFLAGIDPTYFSLLLALYPQIFRLLRLRQAIPGAIALTLVVVWREVLLSGRPPPSGSRAGWRSASAWPATSTTPWPRPSSASCCSFRPPRASCRPARTRPAPTWSGPGARPATT